MGTFRALHAEQGRFRLIHKLRRDQPGRTMNKLRRVTTWSKQNNFPMVEKRRISFKHLRVLEAQRKKRMVGIKAQNWGEEIDDEN